MLLLLLIEHQNTVMSHPITPEKRVVMAIMKLATHTNLRFIGNQFGMAAAWLDWWYVSFGPCAFLHNLQLEINRHTIAEASLSRRLDHMVA
ncbi:hypothetical protein Y1Q_0016085 [Alligator mississippiensis]|uniref:DDE Tnp4 domain-containing protein n=1 Tax=Alligator mississippiensis TaxID=8496 RepID=A0A151P168_ALLMI|nr:hypothetical protein Y1Q_0016085 [Alligator mississippiensis]